MNWTRFALAGVAGFVVSFATGAIWHIPLFGDFYAEQIAEIARPGRGVGLIAVASVVRGFLFAYIYPLGYSGGSPLREGAKFGLLMGLVTAFPTAVYYSQVAFASMAFMWVELIFWVIQGPMIGVAIAYVFGSQAGAKAPAAE